MTEENLKNAERDLLALFMKSKLTIPVSLSALKCGLFHVHFFSIGSWFHFLMSDYSHVLLGGFNKEDSLSTLLLTSFWATYRTSHGDHWVFIEHAGNLQRCIPYFLHLDEGTGLRKSAVLVINLQACWGLDTADGFRKQHASTTDRLDNDMARYMVEAQTHNQRGSSLMSRFLYTLIPKKWYTKKNSFVFDKVLKNIAVESRRLACEGIDGFHPICLGVKGDAPALAKAGHFVRSFMKLGLLEHHRSCAT